MPVFMFFFSHLKCMKFSRLLGPIRISILLDIITMFIRSYNMNLFQVHTEI